MTFHNTIEDEEILKDVCVNEQLEGNLNVDTLEKHKTNWFLYFCTVAVCLPLIPPASMAVWTSSIIPQLKTNDSQTNPLERPITTLEESVLASIIASMSIIGLLILPQVLKSFSRSKGTILSASVMLISLTTIAFATDIILYFVALSIFALGKCAAIIIIPIYIKEMSEPHNRGRLNCFLTATLPVGNFFGFIVGPRTNITVFTIFYCVPIFLYISLYFFVPESPEFLIVKRESAAAARSLEKLRSRKNYTEIIKEYTEIEKRCLSETEKVSFIQSFKSKSFKKAILLIFVSGIVIEAAGISVIMTFAGSIFHDISPYLSGNLVSIIMGAANVVAFLIAAWAIEVYGRRPLMLTSTFFSSLFLFFLGLFFYLKRYDPDLAHSISWVALICISGYILAFGLGIGSLGMCLISDLCDTHIMSSVISFYFLTLSVTSFFVTFSFPYINLYFGTFCSLWIFSASSLMGFVFYYFFLFETKGKSASEIKYLLCK